MRELPEVYPTPLNPLPPSLYAAPPSDPPDNRPAPPVPPAAPPSLVVAPPSDPTDPPAPPATWDPRKPGNSGPFPWEDHAVFRFTFLMWFTRPEDRELLEALGRMIYEMTLEVCGTWLSLPESTTRAEMRAAAYDLRHIEAFLWSVALEREHASLGVEDERLSIMAAEWSGMVGRIAKGIEGAVWPLQGTGGSYYP
ncbi:MAG TPA: hypothetical protein VGG20_25860 [Thermoanaerobaculia bacterium]